ncbi:MAG: bifunctional diaminohydroxyphosphoribosylaminopyrimidine deaminase/5-amino-6-(5-phosphoribosylamino)uracil reductase RibD [Candidatus Micrarchaeota archaeon]
MPASDDEFMQKALILATKGLGATKTNPLVGAVIVKNGKVIATGYHAKFGVPHAEAVALKKAGKKARGAILYVNLEPCVHFEGKKTGPCSELIVNAGINHVVVSMLDPNPKVKGKGIAFLRRNGINVDVGVLKKAASELNLPHLKFVETKKPFVTLKVATSLDGKITKKDAKYFSSKESLKFAHSLRAQSDAILVGIGTILADDPLLTTRLTRGNDPLRVILDAKLRIPLKAKVLADKNVLIFCEKVSYDGSNFKKLNQAGFSVILVKSKSGILDWNGILLELGRRNVGRLLIEGGSKVISSAFENRIVDKAYFIVVPEIFGVGKRLFGPHFKKAPRFELSSSSYLGRDRLLEFIPF